MPAQRLTERLVRFAGLSRTLRLLGEFLNGSSLSTPALLAHYKEELARCEESELRAWLVLLRDLMTRRAFTRPDCKEVLQLVLDLFARFDGHFLLATELVVYFLMKMCTYRPFFETLAGLFESNRKLSRRLGDALGTLEKLLESGTLGQFKINKRRTTLKDLRYNERYYG